MAQGGAAAGKALAAAGGARVEGEAVGEAETVWGWVAVAKAWDLGVVGV